MQENKNQSEELAINLEAEKNKHNKEITIMVEKHKTELENLQDALIIPLGVNVSNALQYLSEQGLVAPGNILSGFPHPSGGNGHRHKQFAENKDAMEEKLNDHFQQVTTAKQIV